MDAISQELRHAARRLSASPTFTLAAILTLALAIAANASIFAVVERVVLNPLPYPDSDRLVEIDHGALSLNLPFGMGLTRGLYYQYRERGRMLDSLAIYRTDDRTLTGVGEPERIRVSNATSSLAAVLRVPPLAGRWFTPQENTPGAARVAVLSHNLWMRRFNGDRGIVGRPVTIDGALTQIIGVMPASFAFPDQRVDAWLPEPMDRSMGFGLWNYRGVARLRPDASLDRLHAELEELIADMPRAFANDSLAIGNVVGTRLVPTCRSLKEATIGTVARALWILLASVGLVLLVACANVANLFLVRSDARQRDVAIRRALGASRASLARYFLAESAWLSAAGAVIGLAGASAAVRLLVAAGPATLPRLHEIRLDAFVIAFVIVLGLVAALLFGAIPLWRLQLTAAALHENGRGNTASARRHRVRHVLMGAQVALALVLLVASGLMVRSFQKLRALDPGFAPESAVAFTIGFPQRDYGSVPALVATHHAILDRLAALPGIASASAATCLPLAGTCTGNTVRVLGRVLPPDTMPPIALFRAVAGGYFETMKMRMLRGRAIDRGDVERREPVVVVNQALAQKLFPGQEAIGQRIASNQIRDLTWLTIVGVVANTPTRALTDAGAFPQIYMPMSIGGGPGAPASMLVAPNVAIMTYVVRTTGSTAGILAAARQAVDSIDRNLAMAQGTTLQDTLDRSAAQMAFTMTLLAIAAAVTLTLGVIGIYGVMSYVVSQRTGEIGVRMALGANPSNVAGMIVRQGGLVALVGAALGLAAAFASGRLIESLLYGISPRDPQVFVATTAGLLLVALGACWLPARRAARLSPAVALRAE